MLGAVVHSKGHIMQAYLARIVVGRLKTCGLLPFKNGTSWMRTQKLVCCDAEYSISDCTVVLYILMYMYVCRDGWVCTNAVVKCYSCAKLILLNEAICPKVQTVQLNHTYILPSENGHV